MAAVSRSKDITPCSLTRFSSAPISKEEMLKGNTVTDKNVFDFEIKRNYFDCGEYFFDGTFNVVKFRKGLTIFHGSYNLSNAQVEFF